jgi:LysM repeat protein
LQSRISGYNIGVTPKKFIRSLLLLVILASFLVPAARVWAAQPAERLAQSSQVTAFDLIVAMNTLRMSYGLPALVEDPIIDAVAQSTAETMAANNMSWHIGDVSGRLAAAGFGGGSKVWGTENFAVGNHSIDQIMLVWSDDSHMIPAVNPAYCNVGAGVAKAANGFTYFILQAAYTAGKSCGEYKSPGGATTNQTGGTTNQGRVAGVSQLIVPVKIATPDADGKIFHVVQAGQSFWSIAMAYKITIHDIEIWNNLTQDSKLQLNQKLFIPGPNTKGFATPTPVGMIQVSTPDKNGKIVHSVAVYQTLSTIAQAYGTSVETLLALNHIQADWPLQIGQKLVIHPDNITPSPTPRPLTPIEKLTPAADGKYYHIIQNGESLSRVADLYKVPVNDLMTWNGLNGASVLHPNQKLVLQVTPPATITPTPAPATATRTATRVRPSPTPSRTPTQPVPTPTAAPAAAGVGFDTWMWGGIIGLAGLGGFLVVFYSRKKR